jgi:SAM-dependent methyltransferase
VDPIRRELRTFYEAEAAAASRGPATARRVQAAAAFASFLAADGRRSVLDVGSGPGTDAATFENSGLVYVGIDLALGNAAIARDRGHTVLAASLFDPPFRAASFDAGWSMSTLMHVPVAEFDTAMSQVLVPLRAEAPLAVGMWGGPEREFRTEPRPDGTRRLFSLRSADHNRELLAAHASVERWEVWDVGPDEWEYHFAVLRSP